MEQILRWMIRVAVESFPINQKKKEDILQRLAQEKTRGGERHVL